MRWSATLAFDRALGLPGHAVAVPMVITKTSEGARALANCAAAEHLELTGVFAACQEVGVCCGAVLAVADHVGPKAYLVWKANNLRVSAALVQTIKDRGVFDLD